MALIVPRDEWPTSLGVDDEMLLLVLPDDLALCLPALASSTLDVYNRDSDDLLTRKTLLSLKAGDIRVEVDAWRCCFPTEIGEKKFYIGLAAGNRFVVSCHDYGKKGLESLTYGTQGACSSSGPNYRPWRYWSDEELEAAARGESPRRHCDSTWVEPSRRVECRCVDVKT